MAVRTVSVELKMQIADFLRGAGEASAATKILSSEFDGLSKKSEKFSTAKASKEMQNFSRVINASLKDGETGFQSIQRSIDDTKTHIANLRKEFATTGNASVFGDLKSAQKDLRTLENIFKEIAPAASEGGQEAGGNFLKGFATEAVKLGDVAGPVGIAFGAAIALIATPIIVSALTAGVAGAIGAGVIAAGALIEKNDPVIQAAFAPLKKTISSTLAGAALPLQQSFEDAIRSVDLFVQREGPALKGLFTSVAPAVAIITSGVESLVAKLLPQFTAIGAEFTKALANPNVHAALVHAEDDFAKLFKTIGNNPQVIAVGFETIGKAVSFVSGFMSGLINITGHVINGFDDATKALGDFFGGPDSKNLFLQQQLQAAAVAAKDTTGIFSGLGRTVADVGTAATRSATNFNALGDVVKEFGRQVNDLANGALQNLQNQTLAMREGQLGFNASVLQSISTLKDGKKSLSQHTAAGIADNQTIDQSIKLNLDQYDSNITAKKGVDQSTKAFNANLDAMEASFKKAGVLTQGVKDLIESYRKVPVAKSTGFNAPGLAAAKADAGEYGSILRNIPHKVTTNVETVYSTKGHPPSGPLARNIQREGGVYEHADMGLVNANVYSPMGPARYAFAEPQTGGEAFIPKYGDYGRSMSIISAAAGWYNASVVPNGGGGGGGGPVTLYVMAGDDTSRALVKSLRYGISQGGGDPVRVLTPRGA